MTPDERKQAVESLSLDQLLLLLWYLSNAAADIVDEALLTYGWGPEAGRG